MRPKLNKETNPEEFFNYYWLKEELFAFCKSYMIPQNGSKQDLTNRIFHYLKTGENLKIAAKKTSKKNTHEFAIKLDSKIKENYTNDEIHRAFFKNEIGIHFKFNVPFMN